MSERMQGHNHNIVQALHNIHALQLEDTVRQRQIEEASKSLEALLRMPSTSTSGRTSTTTPAPPSTLPTCINSNHCDHSSSAGSNSC